MNDTAEYRLSATSGEIQLYINEAEKVSSQAEIGKGDKCKIAIFTTSPNDS